MSGLVLDATGLVSGSMTRRVRSYASLALRGLLVSVAYYFGSLLGYALLFPSSYISVIWPPNTVLLVALLLSSPLQWPWLLLIAFPMHLLAQAQLGASLSAAGLYYAFNCVLVPITAAVMRRFGLGDLALGDLRQTLIFIAVTTITVAVGSLVWSPLIVSLWFGGDLWSAWYLTSLSNLLPFLIATPGLVIGFTRGADTIRKASLAQYTEFALLALGLLGCGIVRFGLKFQAVGKLPALLYAPLPFLLWAAVRFGPGGLSFSCLIFALLAIFSAIAGYGPFITESAADNVLWLQIFLLAVYLPLLALASVVEERRTKEETLRRNEAALQASYKQIQDLAGRLITAQEAERSRIAGELHDDVNQQLAGLSIALSNVKRQLQNGGDGTVQNELTLLQQRTVDLADVICNLSHELHPGVLQHAGLAAALKGHCAEVGRQHAFEVTLSVAEGLDGIPDDVALCLYRVAQEALRNVAAHAGARKAQVTLRSIGEGLELVIADDGQGFDLAEARHQEGLGLISLDERVRLVGGSLTINTEPRRGTEVRVQVPLGGTP